MLLEQVNVEANNATARKYVSGSEPFALGHYAANPIFPGVLSLQLMLDLTESLLNLSGLSHPAKFRIKRTQYLDMVRPGDILDLEAEIIKRTEKQINVSARVSCLGVPKARGTFTYEI